jgi:hypothetical protein
MCEWHLEIMKNPVKLHKKKPPKKGREKETRGKDQGRGKQTAQKRRATWKQRKSLKYWNQTYTV